MARVFPLHANLGKAKPGKKRRKRGATASLKAPAPSVGLAEKAASARKETLGKLLRVRLATSSSSVLSKSRKPAPIRKLVVPDLRPLDLPTILRIWKNAVRLYASQIGHEREMGRQAIATIEKEWARRKFLPLNPEDFFFWPSTDALGGSKDITFGNSPLEGLLAYLEYHVGQTKGESAPVRKIILERVFMGVLPPVFSDQYLAQWSSPGSAPRLQKLAESIAAFCRNAKRRDPTRLADAIKSWEEDLKYLYEQYYVGKFGFGWPASTVS